MYAPKRGARIFENIGPTLGLLFVAQRNEGRPFTAFTVSLETREHQSADEGREILFLSVECLFINLKVCRK